MTEPTPVKVENLEHGQTLVDEKGAKVGIVNGKPEILDIKGEAYVKVALRNADPRNRKTYNTRGLDDTSVAWEIMRPRGAMVYVEADRLTPQEPEIGDTVTGMRARLRGTGEVAFTGRVVDVMTETDEASGKTFTLLHVKDDKVDYKFLVNPKRVQIIKKGQGNG